ILLIINTAKKLSHCTRALWLSTLTFTGLPSSVSYQRRSSRRIIPLIIAAWLSSPSRSNKQFIS
ncbi:TPA: hypothetical protein ACJGKV_004221, partial [Salmonella enterica subsp. diarizonae serovar 61:l,v:1,5,7]